MRRGVFRPLAAGIFAAACALSLSATADPATDEAAILDIWETYSSARVAGDVETWLGLWDEEGIRMVPGVPAVDFATFAPITAERFANAPASMEINSEEIVVADDWAYSRGTFTVNDVIEGKFLTIFRRQDDGSWRIFRDAMNMNTE